MEDMIETDITHEKLKEPLPIASPAIELFLFADKNLLLNEDLH